MEQNARNILGGRLEPCASPAAGSARVAGPARAAMPQKSEQRRAMHLLQVFFEMVTAILTSWIEVRTPSARL